MSHDLHMTSIPMHSPQVFYFPLSQDEAAAALPPTCVAPSDSLTKLLVGVYHKNISSEMSASISLPLTDIKTTVSITPHSSC